MLLYSVKTNLTLFHKCYGKMAVLLFLLLINPRKMSVKNVLKVLFRFVVDDNLKSDC